MLKCVETLMLSFFAHGNMIKHPQTKNTLAKLQKFAFLSKIQNRISEKTSKNILLLYGKTSR